MKIVKLNNGWKMVCKNPQNEASINFDDICGEWMDISVPGDVNNTLMEYGKIPDPHYDTQAKECYWVSSKEWWYKLEFDVMDGLNKDADLCMTQVDGNTDVWLNGLHIGHTKNAFRLHRFNVKNALKQSGNVLIIRFKSIDSLLGGPRLDELGGWLGRRAYLRKPQFNFGWDWALPLPSIGLAGDVWLEIDNQARLTEVAIQPFIDGRVDFSFEVSEAAKSKGYRIEVKLKGHGAQLSSTIDRGTYRSYTSINIPEPKLWFPNGFGEQNLYDYEIELLVNGEIADAKKGKIGLRESSIVEKPFTPEAGPGFSFWLEINKTLIFCKGANWIPMEIWPGTIKPQDYRYYLNRAKEANFNMLRVWGGGIYENDLFYEICDELGIMVWQDFMFASTGYPVEPLRDEIMAEAEYQIKRLRNHTSIVLWCGINEDVHSWDYKSSNIGGQKDSGLHSETDDIWRVDRAKDDPQIFTMILRGLVSKYGNQVPYIESSPQSKDDFGNMVNSGNSHVSCWKYSLFESDGKYENFRDHFNKVCSFNSEFCIQGPSSVKMIKSFLEPKNYWPPNEAWIYHIQRGHANLPHHEQTMSIAGSIFGEIDSLQKYVKHGQATHIEMMRAEFESARRDWPNNGGTMMWMYNDCWPTANWSIIDYYKNPKPSYYAAKRGCAQLLPIIFERNEKIGFFFSNHTGEEYAVEIEYGQEDLLGANVWHNKTNIKVKANSCSTIIEIDKKDIKITKDQFLYIDASVNGEKLKRVIYFVDGWKNINWPDPIAQVSLVNEQQIESNKWHSDIKIKTKRFARLLHLKNADQENSVIFDDNFFDMAADSEYIISLNSTNKIKMDKINLGHWLTDWE